MLGGWLALLAAATFALSNVSARRAVIEGTVLQGLFVTIPIGLIFLLIVTLISGSAELLFQFTLLQFLSLGAAGICHFAIARYCAYRSIQALGSNLAGPVQRLSLPVSLALALWLLDEYLNPLRAFGVVLVIFGPIIMLSGQVVSDSSASTNAFKPRFLEGYFFAVLSAVGFGVSPLFVRVALEGVDMSTAIAGGVYSYVAAALVLMPISVKQSVRRTILTIRKNPAKWFVISGLFTGISQMIRYMALALAPVTIVSSIMVTSLVFRFLFSRIINRDHEIFGIWVVIGIAITIVGSLALTLETAFVFSLLPEWDWLHRAARWRWPAA